MQPDDCVEAFETKFGSPMIGIQWHPEAFNPNEKNAEKHQAIFKFMVDTGETYLNRRKLNEEFKQIISPSKNSFFCEKKINSDLM